MSRFHLLLLCCLIFAIRHHCSDAYKVLVYSQTMTRSHVILNARVAETLAADGHNVTILEVEYLEPVANFSGSDAKGVRKIGVSGNFLSSLGDELKRFLAERSFDPITVWSLLTSRADFKMFQDQMNEACEKFMDEQWTLIEQLRNEQFDMFIGEQLNFCGSALSWVLRIPVHVLLVSCPIQEHVSTLLGLPMPSSYVPSIYGVPMGDRMSLWERFSNWLGMHVYEEAFLYGVDQLTAMFRRRFGSDFPSVRHIVSNSPLVFVNVDEFADFPRPVFHHLVYIGGLELEGASRSKPLEEPFKSEMEKGEKGVVYFSLGSAVKTDYLREPFMRNAIQAFASLPDWHFVVKAGDEDAETRRLARQAPNVHITSWAPQRAILAHPRLRLFITHGGYNSLLESALAGVPLLSIGFFADQRMNARMVERNGWGLAFENRALLDDTSDQFARTIERMLREQSFAQNARRLQRILATKPFAAREKLTKYIRFLELNGGRLPELLPQSRHMGPLQLHNIDLALVALGLVLSAILAFWAGVWLLCCRSRRGTQRRTKVIKRE